jgi:hypothetical protein
VAAPSAPNAPVTAMRRWSSCMVISAAVDGAA